MRVTQLSWAFMLINDLQERGPNLQLVGIHLHTQSYKQITWQEYVFTMEVIYVQIDSQIYEDFMNEAICVDLNGKGIKTDNENKVTNC